MTIDVRDLHVVSDREARQLAEDVLGAGTDWQSGLVGYRTMSAFQSDWLVEVGNWLARARASGYLHDVVRNVEELRGRPGSRDPDDPVHRTLTQWLFHGMATHYFSGTGWHLSASEPRPPVLRGSGELADVDLEFRAPDGTVVDMALKASGTLGCPPAENDRHIRDGVRNAIQQLPVPPIGPAFVVIGAQRDWLLSEETFVLETMIGSTCSYPDGRTLLHDDACGELAGADHVSGIVILDLHRGETCANYVCSVLLNPWAYYLAREAWFPHARVLTFDGEQFCWMRGQPLPTHFPSGTRRAPGAIGSGIA